MQQLNDVSQQKQEAVRVGNLIVLSQHDQQALAQQKQNYLAQGYQVHETPHFVVCQKPSSEHVLLMHIFNQADIDADLICLIEDELAPLELLPSERAFGATLFAVLASTFPSPRNQPAIWQQFSLNTLNRLRDQIAHPLDTFPSVSYIAPFAAIYRRVKDLYQGQSLLDVGCSFGFLPVIMAEYKPDIHIVGCDSNPDAIGFSSDLAAITTQHGVLFMLQDVLDTRILDLGCFDTVTAIHVFEHLQEDDIYLALNHLLQVTSQRLIIAVPYEEQA